MKLLLSVLIVIFTGVIGAYLDLELSIDRPILYWLIGFFGGALAVLVQE